MHTLTWLTPTKIKKKRIKYIIIMEKIIKKLKQHDTK
jgi:hypothetical protein